MVPTVGEHADEARVPQPRQQPAVPEPAGRGTGSTASPSIRRRPARRACRASRPVGSSSGTGRLHERLRLLPLPDDHQAAGVRERHLLRGRLRRRAHPEGGLRGLPRASQLPPHAAGRPVLSRHGRCAGRGGHLQHAQHRREHRPPPLRLRPGFLGRDPPAHAERRRALRPLRHGLARAVHLPDPLGHLGAATGRGAQRPDLGQRRAAGRGRVRRDGRGGARW